MHVEFTADIAEGVRLAFPRITLAFIRSFLSLLRSGHGLSLIYKTAKEVCAAVLEAAKRRYESYVKKCQRDGRSPLKFDWDIVPEYPNMNDDCAPIEYFMGFFFTPSYIILECVPSATSQTAP
eukprot:6204971-Pleurochrysis_carterae.AAC.3